MSFDETSFARDRPVASFFVLTFVLSYVVGVLVAILLQFVLPPSLRDSADVVAKYGPTFAGLIMAWTVAGESGLMKLLSGLLTFRVHLGWYAFAVVVPFVLVLLSIVVFAATGGTIQSENWSAAAVTPLLVLILTKVFLGGGLGEELGWRGFALPQLQKRMTALKASLMIWIVWSAWHYPAFALDSNREGEMPILMFTIFVLTVRVGEAPASSTGLPWQCPPFPASCPVRFAITRAGPPPSQTRACRIPAPGSSSATPRTGPSASDIRSLQRVTV
jgi:membrane protease YdiL (CAAX protease family)